MTKFIQNLELHKYPSTRHLEGSQLQQGDTGFDKPKKRDDPRAAYSMLAGRTIVVEEKLDGANAGVSFDAGADLLLQSRGHYLAGGGRERQSASSSAGPRRMRRRCLTAWATVT